MSGRLNTIENPRSPEKSTLGSIVSLIVAISAVACIFLCWLVYYHQPTDAAGNRLVFLPALNAALNALSAVALVIGFCYIRAGRVAPHRASMVTAFVFSSLFLVCYITNHALHGDMLFRGLGGIRTAYFALLISAHRALGRRPSDDPGHAFFLSLTGRFPAHRRLARFTFPIWLYVSVTGVVVYSMLAAYR